MNRAVPQQQIAELSEQVQSLSEEVATLRAQVRSDAAFLSERDVARELGKRRSLIREWKRSGKLKPVDMGGKHPMFRRADIERVKAEGLSVLKKLARQPRPPRAPAPSVEVEPLESMLARAKQLAKEARARDKRERESRERTRSQSPPRSPSQKGTRPVSETGESGQ